MSNPLTPGNSGWMPDFEDPEMPPAKEKAEARRSAAACSPGSELRAGYKIAFSNYGQVKRWRILKIQNGLALVTEGWGVHKLLSVTSIAVAPYMIEQTRFPWYLRPFYRENIPDQPR